MAPRLEVARWSPDLRGELSRAAVSVSRCGYNTAIDVIASSVAALMVPYATPAEDEQTRRATRLAHLGVVRTVPEEGLTPESLAEEIRRTARWSPVSIALDTNGGPRSAELLRA